METIFPEQADSCFGPYKTGVLFLILGLSISSAYSTFSVVYPVFIAFLSIGFGLTWKEQTESKTI